MDVLSQCPQHTLEHALTQLRPHRQCALCSCLSQAVITTDGRFSWSWGVTFQYSQWLWCTPAVYWGRVGRGNKCAFVAQVVSLHNDLEQQMHQLLLSEGTAGNTFHAFFFLNKTLRKTHFKTVAWSLKAALFVHCVRAFLNPAGKTEALKVISTFSYFWSNI